MKIAVSFLILISPFPSLLLALSPHPAYGDHAISDITSYHDSEVYYTEKRGQIRRLNTELLNCIHRPNRHMIDLNSFGPVGFEPGSSRPHLYFIYCGISPPYNSRCIQSTGGHSFECTSLSTYRQSNSLFFSSALCSLCLTSDIFFFLLSWAHCVTTYHDVT